MKLIILTEDAYETIIERLNAIENTLKEKQTSRKAIWLDNQELLQYLKISRRTAQSYRDKNMLPFTLIGNKLFYKMADVEDLLNRYYHKRLQ